MGMQYYEAKYEGGARANVWASSKEDAEVKATKMHKSKLLSVESINMMKVDKDANI